MSSSDPDWRKMVRVISGAVGKDLLKEEREKQKEEYPVDRSIFSIRDWDREWVFRNMINMRGLSEEGRRFLELGQHRFRHKEMITFMQQNQDSLSTWAVMDQEDKENNGNSFRDIMHFIWHFRYDLGPWMQGKLIEIIGPMRSGKNNFAVYTARAAMSGKIHVITSFPMFFPTTQDGPLKEYYSESHSLREAILYMVTTRYKEPDAIFFLILDEQTTRGASSMRSNSTEAEWANGWIVRSGHFGCTTIRLMQSGEETIKMQKNLRYAEIYKNPRNVDRAEGKFMTFGDEWPLTFQKIPDMAKYFNTASPGSWIWDVDSQAMNDYMAGHEGETTGDTVKIYRFYERYIRILQRTDDPYWFQNDKYRGLDRDIKELEAENKKKEEAEAARIAEEANRKPLPLHHENCPRVGNGLSWTWTPKKYVPEGAWVTCSKCKKGFKVHYSVDRDEKPQNEDSKVGEKEKNDTPDLKSEGYRGMDHEENSGQNSGSITADLNTHDQDPTGQKSQDPPKSAPEAMTAAEDLAADAMNLFMDVVQDPEKMKALESDPEAMARFKKIMNTEIPVADVQKVMLKASRKRKLTMKVPELEAESTRLRNDAAEKHQCANCGNPLTGNQLYYCSDNCKLEFYNSHPTSISWNDVRKRALERDQNTCVKCGKTADEVDHVKEIWEGGPEFDLDNLQSLCHDCHVAKTNESRKKRGITPEALEQGP